MSDNTHAAMCVYCGEAVIYDIREVTDMAAAHAKIIEHDQQCAKNPLVARIARLERERDAYRTAEEHQIALRQKLEEERDALAALFVRLQDGATDLIHASSEEEAGDAMELIAECSEKEARNILARRDALKQAEALERLRLLLQETQFDKAPSVARVVMQVKDAINRVKQEVRPLRLVASDHSDPHPNCELECGAYGTYCKCNAEAQQ